MKSIEVRVPHSLERDEVRRRLDTALVRAKDEYAGGRGPPPCAADRQRDEVRRHRRHHDRGTGRRPAGSGHGGLVQPSHPRGHRGAAGRIDRVAAGVGLEQSLPRGLAGNGAGGLGSLGECHALHDHSPLRAGDRSGGRPRRLRWPTSRGSTAAAGRSVCRRTQSVWHGEGTFAATGRSPRTAAASRAQAGAQIARALP